ncbi:MAG: YdcF family protein [Clostridia bacterium]|nr:YdcF family protein [Clostridia bacterium]MBR3954302.1 YdcF family protein [Clostridia bacterium]
MKKIISVAVCVVILFLTFTAVSIVNYGKNDHKTQADVAIVLGAAASDEGVSPVFRERINHGIWLYENEFVDYLIFTGGMGEGNAKSDALIAKEYALSQGVPADVILIEEKSTITEENLENAKEIMDENGLRTAIIVSDPLHMKRAMLMAKDYGIDGYSSPTPTTMYRSIKAQFPFLVREEFFYIGYCIVRIFR